MKKLAIIALFLFLPLAAQAYSVFDYTSGQFVSVSSFTYSGTSAFLQGLTVNQGTIGYCTNCAVPLCVSSATINAFVQGSSSTLRCQ